MKTNTRGEYYVAATQCGVVKLHRGTPSEVAGLCTTELKACLGIVLYRSNGHISLMHLDGTEGIEAVKAEFQKFEKGNDLERCEIWRRSHPDECGYKRFDDDGYDAEDYEKAAHSLEKIQKEIKELSSCEPQLTTTGVFYVDRDGKSAAGDHKNIVSILQQSGQEARHSINMLNHMCGVQGLDEQYDGTKWSEEPLKLTGKAQEFVAEGGNSTNAYVEFCRLRLKKEQGRDLSKEEKCELQWKWAEQKKAYDELPDQDELLGQNFDSGDD